MLNDLQTDTIAPWGKVVAPKPRPDRPSVKRTAVSAPELFAVIERRRAEAPQR